MSAVLSLAWAVLRVVVFTNFVFPLTYALPLLVCIWTRDKVMLWSMAVLFAVLSTLKQFWLLPADALPPYADWATWAATIFNIGVGAVAVHVIIQLIERLESSLKRMDAQADELARQNEELAQQTEEMSVQSEELSQQVEELSHQSEEMSQQNEELQSQSEEINSLNAELAHRENLLQTLLDAARLSGTERAAMEQICSAATGLLGGITVVYEKQGDTLTIRATGGAGDAGTPDRWPAHHAFADLVVEQNRTACLNDTSLRPDLAILTVPGRPRFGAVLAAPMRRGGAPFGAVAVYTAQRQEWTAEQFRLVEWLAAQCAHILEILRLQQDLTRRAALIDLSPDGIMVRRMDGTIELWGHGAECLYGWTKQEAIGRTSHDLLKTRFPEPLDKIEEQLERTGRWAGELIHTTRDGSEVVVQSRWLAQRDAGGAITELLESNVDLTEQRLAQESLSRSETQLRLATLAAEIGVWSWTPGTSEVAVSANWRRLFGVAPDTPVTFETWTGALHPDDRERAVAELNAASDQHREFDAEYRVVWPDGTVRWLVDRGRASYDDSGRPIGMAGVNLDITARKQAEEALREVDRRKNEFLATLSHELRNPLAPIRYALELIDADHGRPSQPKQVIERQLAHLVRLVDDLLDVTRIASNKVRLRTRRVDLGPIVQHAVEAAMPDIEHAQHDLAVSLPSTPVWLDADADRLAQVLTNLLTNAARYTPPHGRIALRAAPLDGDVVISVGDNGIGLSGEDLPRVFEMFTQVGEPGHGGLGIGLALVKGLVELHGGQVEARSAGLGQGSEFVVRLRCAETPVVESAGMRSNVTSANRRRILVVDDNDDAAEMMKTFLELHGHEVRVAHDAPSALGILEAFKAEVGLFDIGLPKINGYELAARVRQDPANCEMYLVAVTGWGQEEDRHRARQSGFDAHLTKPADPDEVQRLIGRINNRAGC